MPSKGKKKVVDLQNLESKKVEYIREIGILFYCLVLK